MNYRLIKPESQHLFFKANVAEVESQYNQNIFPCASTVQTALYLTTSYTLVDTITYWKWICTLGNIFEKIFVQKPCATPSSCLK